MSKAQHVVGTGDQALSTSLDNLDNKNLFCHLDHLSVVEIGGNDATTFLHGQFTNDVENLGENEIQLNGYCDPKGRLIALFYLIRFANHYTMLIEDSILDNVVKRLQMFVLMANVEFSTSSLACFGFVHQDKSIPAYLNDFTSESNKVLTNEGVIAAQLPSDSSRYLLICEPAQTDNLIEENCLRCDSSVWRLFDIKLGIPSLLEKTQGCFVPQMMNLDLVSGLSFSKGCYPGQEVVARMHHLGKLKRRMVRLGIVCEEMPLVGDGIYSTDSINNESVGKIISTVATANNEYDALAVLLIKHCDDPGLYLDDGTDTKITFSTLPYDIPDCNS